MTNIKLTVKQLKQLEKWFNLNIIERISNCPFDPHNPHLCFTTCWTLFPTILQGIESWIAFNSDDWDLCPCIKLSEKYVMRKVQELLLLKGVDV